MKISARARISKPKVYVTYATQNSAHPILRRLLEDLRRGGADLWMPMHEIQPGDGVFESTANRLRKSEFLLCVVSANAVGYGATNMELLGLVFAQERRVDVLIARLDDTALPSDLVNVDSIDLFHGYDVGLSTILQTIHAVRSTDSASFQIDTAHDHRTIVEVTDLVGRSLIQRFARHPGELMGIDRRLFEELVAELFLGFGYQVELTKKTRDGGRDIIAVRRNEVAVRLFECKRPDPSGYVGIRPVRELYGIKNDEHATKAILATTVHFSPDAMQFFQKHIWEMEPRDYDGLLEWIRDYLKTQGT